MLRNIINTRNAYWGYARKQTSFRKNLFIEFYSHFKCLLTQYDPNATIYRFNINTFSYCVNGDKEYQINQIIKAYYRNKYIKEYTDPKFKQLYVGTTKW